MPQFGTVALRKMPVFKADWLVRGLHIVPSKVADNTLTTRAVGGRRESLMMAMMSFATLLIGTLFATGVAVLLDWLMLRVAFHLMQPAARKPLTQPAVKHPVNARVERGELVRGTAQLVRAYSAHR
jgi:hypothetical protein